MKISGNTVWLKRLSRSLWQSKCNIKESGIFLYQYAQSVPAHILTGTERMI